MKSETASSLKEKIKNECDKLGLPMVGFAPKERWEQPPNGLPQHFSCWIPREFWPQSIYPEVQTVIVIGLPVPPP